MNVLYTINDYKLENYILLFSIYKIIIQKKKKIKEKIALQGLK